MGEPAQVSGPPGEGQAPTRKGVARYRAAAFLHYRAAALPRYRAAALPRYRAAALPRYRAAAFPSTPSSRPASANAVTARSMCSFVCAAESCTRMRARPFGTTGNEKPMT